MKHQFARAAGRGGVALMLCAAANAAPHYVVNSMRVTDLGTVGGPIANANDINDRGDIVGWSYTAAGAEHAFLITGGLMTDIGPSISNGFSAATGINNAGQVVGWGDWKQLQQMGFLYSAGFSQTLFGPGASAPPDLTAGWKINDAGDVGGVVNHPWPYALDAITWKASGPIFLMPSSAHDDQAFDINASGSMTGYSSRNVAWRWTLSGNVVTQSQQVPWPAATGYADGEGHGINDRGAVVGRFYIPAKGTYHAFFWDGRASRSVDLGVLPKGISSEAEDINEDRFIAGHASEQYAAGPAQFRERGFVFHRDFGMVALPGLPGALKSDTCRAYALNEWKSEGGRLQVVGGCDLLGNTRAVRWDLDVALVP